MRLEITRKADLATRALLELAGARHRLKGAELAERLGASGGFLAQAMTPLVTRGWVRSEPGPTGGYELVADLGRVSVLEVIEAVEGPIDVGQCVLESRACASGVPCALHQPWSKARTLLLAELGSSHLGDLLSARPRR